MIVAAFAVTVFANAPTASADCSVTPTVKVGSTGANVMCVQTIVGATADGSFGPMTKAAVMAWQAGHSLVADGVVGPMTAAKMNASPVGGTFPAGCSSASGYSTTTGMPCTGGSNLPAGCTSTAGFSPTTGMSCSGGSTPTSTGPLTGGAGDATITDTSTDVETTVNEGTSDTKVLGFKVEADGGDIALTNVKVSMIADGASSSSYRLNHYISGVSVWMGSTKVGSADVDEFTKTGNLYTKSISLDNATVREGSSKKATFYVTVDALDNIDTTDFNGTWSMSASNVRFQDSTGVVLTSSFGGTSTDLEDLDGTDEGENNFDFQSLASSGDVKVVVSKDSSSPDAQNVVGDDSSSTKNVLLLAFKVKATGSDVTFDTLNITTALSGVSGDVRTDIASELQLKNGSDTLATFDGADLDGTETFNLDDTFTISADTTEVFKVYATINQIDGTNLHSGSAMGASFASFSPEDENGDIVTDTGSAAGNNQTFVVDVPTVALVGTPTLAVSTQTDGTATGEEDTYKATIVMDVTAPDAASIYLPLDTFSYGTSGAAGVEFTVTGGATVVSAALQYSGTDSILDTNSYRVDAGATQRFTFNVYLRGNDTQGKVTLTSLWYETAAGTPDGTPEVTSGWTNFKTPLVLLAK